MTVDISTRTIKRLFEEQIKTLTQETVAPRESLIDYQLSGGWLQ